MSRINTVLGKVDSLELARVLPHEHIASAYGYLGRQQPTSNEQWEEELLAHYTPMLQTLREQYDCNALVECSPSYGFRQERDLALWAELSERTGVTIIASTGYYVDRIRPPDFSERTVTQIADTMILEAVEGILGTHIQAGIIKIAVGKMDADDRKLVKAAAIAQRETGLSITTHTCSPEARRATLDLLEGAGTPMDRVVLGHADDNATPAEMVSLARRGCSLLFTIWGIVSPETIGWGLPALPLHHSASLVAVLVAEGHCDQVLMSIDYSAGYRDSQFTEDLYEVEGRTYLYMFTHALGTLHTMGVPDDALEHIMRENPRRMLSYGA